MSEDEFGLDDSDIDALEEQGWDDIREVSNGRDAREGESYRIKRRSVKPDRILESFRSGYNDFDIKESNQLIEDAVKDIVFELEGPMNRSAGVYSYKKNEDGRIEECSFRTEDGFIDGSLVYENPFGCVKHQITAEIDVYLGNDMNGRSYDVLRDEAKRIDEVIEPYVPEKMHSHFQA